MVQDVPGSGVTAPTLRRVEVAPRIEQPYRVRFDECGADGRLRSSAYLRYAQEMAWVHSDLAGFDRHWYAERELGWLVRCMELEVVAPISHGDSMRVSTAVDGFRRVWARRRSEFRAGIQDERVTAVAITDWVLLGPTGPVSPPQEIHDRFEVVALVPFTPGRVRVVQVPDDARDVSFGVRRRDLDPLGHVNNATYLDYLEEVVAGAGGEDDLAVLPRRYRLEYLVPAEADSRLRARSWRTSEGWRFQLEGGDGTTLCRGQLETEPGLFVGD